MTCSISKWKSLISSKITKINKDDNPNNNLFCKCLTKKTQWKNYKPKTAAFIAIPSSLRQQLLIHLSSSTNVAVHSQNAPKLEILSYRQNLRSKLWRETGLCKPVMKLNESTNYSRRHRISFLNDLSIEMTTTCWAKKPKKPFLSPSKTIKKSL